MSDSIDWDSVKRTIKEAIDDAAERIAADVRLILEDAQNGHFPKATVAVEYEPPAEPNVTLPPTANPYGNVASSGNPYSGNGNAGGGSYSGIEEVDRPGISPLPTPEQPIVKLAGQRVVDAALTQVGQPYGWGATGPNSWDCSGLTQWAYRSALGIEIGRTTYDQIKGGIEVPFSEAAPGDLIFSNFSARGPEHVSINMEGPDNVVEAGDPVGVYKWGNRGRVVVKRYV
jgi:cell wall-associated NlpC family hydrolase